MTPYIPIAHWWCCLHGREKNTLIFLHGAWFTNPLYVGRATFEAACIITGASSSILMLENFMATYGLHYEMISCGEDCWIDAVVFDGPFWALLHEFWTETGLACEQPCKLLTWPE